MQPSRKVGSAADQTTEKPRAGYAEDQPPVEQETGNAARKAGAEAKEKSQEVEQKPSDAAPESAACARESHSHQCADDLDSNQAHSGAGAGQKFHGDEPIDETQGCEGTSGNCKPAKPHTHP